MLHPALTALLRYPMLEGNMLELETKISTGRGFFVRHWQPIELHWRTEDTVTSYKNSTEFPHDQHPGHVLKWGFMLLRHQDVFSDEENEERCSCLAVVDKMKSVTKSIETIRKLVSTSFYRMVLKSCYLFLPVPAYEQCMLFLTVMLWFVAGIHCNPIHPIFCGGFISLIPLRHLGILLGYLEQVLQHLEKGQIAAARKKVRNTAKIHWDRRKLGSEVVLTRSSGVNCCSQKENAA